MQKPARKQGRTIKVACYALAYARASASRKLAFGFFSIRICDLFFVRLSMVNYGNRCFDIVRLGADDDDRNRVV